MGFRLFLLFTLSIFGIHASSAGTDLTYSNWKCVELFDEATADLSILKTIETSTASIGRNQLGYTRERFFELVTQDPRLDWIVDDLLRENVEFAMNRNEDLRLALVENGFLNQFQTKTTDAYYDPHWRKKVESKYSGVSFSSYERVPLAVRPKYGYLAPAIDSPLRREAVAQGFGKDVYLFRKEKLRNRTTWMAGDSLDQTFDDRIEKVARFHLWKDRDLLLPKLFVQGAEKPKQLALPIGSPEITLSNGRKFDYGNAPLHQYIELQFWGELTFDDVESFIFTKTPPSGIFLQALRRRKISIYHGKGKQNLPWNGP